MISLATSVVICFHFCIFVVLATTASPMTKMWKGCDLLSFLYLCRTGNNSQDLVNILASVVICFHFCIFVVLATTNSLIHIIMIQL